MLGCLLALIVATGAVSAEPGEPAYRSRLMTWEVEPEDGPVVNTRYGPVLGRTVPSSSGMDWDDVLVDEFLGLPFAEAPVGARRWQRPVPLSQGWEGPLNGTVYGQHCIQGLTDLYPLIGMGGEHGEDCLTLNIYRPTNIGSEPLPVMVFAFGGGFQMGTGEMYPGGFLATEGRVIVVNYNYRVGTIGFLSTGDSVIPGNYGLWDTRAVLQWVQDNIANFGGDRDRVTLFGQSAGGSAVSHSVLSPEMTGLFHRAFAISGASTALFGSTTEQREWAFGLADQFACGAGTTQEVADCLREQDAEELLYWGNDLPVENGRAPGWLPVIDGAFVPADPIQAFRDGAGNIPEVDFITGSTKHDAAGMLMGNPIGLPLLNDSLCIAYDKELLLDFVRTLFGYAENGEELVGMTYERYPGLDSDVNQTRILEGTQMGTDLMFETPAHFEAAAHARASNKNTYAYQFHYRQSFFVDGSYPMWVQGSHLDDLYTFFGPAYFQVYRDYYLEQDFDETDLQFSRDTIKYISNFAYTGNPNTGPWQPAAVWPQYGEEKNYLELSPSMRQTTPDAERLEKYRFWEELPDVPRTPDDDQTDTFSRWQGRTPTEDELVANSDMTRYRMYENVGFDKPAMDAIDRQTERVLAKMHQRMKKLSGAD